MKHIVLFASGSGSNVENIVHYFKDHPNISVICVLTNKKEAKVIERCERLNISLLYFNKTAFFNSSCILDILKAFNPHLIVLAGFLLKIPKNLVQNFPNKIINIHPALLPKYGGKGMYGINVHKAVLENQEEETGITVHFVNENYDEGGIIHQAKVKVLKQDTAEIIAKKVHQLEYEYFPKIIERILLKQ
ncbi:MAG: phosphoribosylglycinamide formyltransferase [Bacteroidota bacterium]